MAEVVKIYVRFFRFLRISKPEKPGKPNSIFKESPIDFQGEIILKWISTDVLVMPVNVSAENNLFYAYFSVIPTLSLRYPYVVVSEW